MKQLFRSEIILDSTIVNQTYGVTTNGYCLIVDTETHTDIGQKAKLAMFTLFDLKQASNNPTAIEYVAQGMVNYDLNQNECLALKQYCKEHNLKYLSKQTFINNVLYPSLANGVMLVGHNINFDIGALCTDFMTVPNTKQFRFKMCTCEETSNTIHTHTKIALPCSIHPCIIVEQVKTKKYLMYVECDNYSPIVDTITLGNAFLGMGKSGLDAMIKRYGYTDMGKKHVTDYGNEYDYEFFEYSMHDVYLTSMLISAEYKLYSMHGIDKPFHTIMSEASVGKAYMEKLGVPAFRQYHREVPKFMYDRSNAAYYGGRSEVHIKMKPTQILYCDFKSQYPLVNALLNSQRYLLAGYLKLDHCVEYAQDLINTITLDDLRNKETWLKLSILVKIEANNAILPARLEINSYTKIYGQMTISPDNKPVVAWYSMLDIIASKIRTGVSPIILDAYRLIPQNSIKTNEIDVLGNSKYHVDLSKDDFFVKVIDLRDSVKAELKQVKNQIKITPTTELYQRQNFLDNLQLALKLMANSTSYGILVETREVERQDIAGKYNSMPIGIHITSGARLLLAIAEKLGLDRGIEHAFCDTDSFAYAKSGDMNEETFHNKVMECINWFNSLSPYASNDNIFELEEYNYLNGVLTPLYTLCISAKRYVLYNKLENGKFLIRKMSEHGLQNYLTDNDIELSDDMTEIERDELGKRKHKPERYALWYRGIEQIENNIFPIVPNEVWSSQFAITQSTVSTPRQYGYFSYITTVRPFSFFVVTPESKYKNRKFRYYLPFISHAGLLEQSIKNNKVRVVKTNEIVHEIELDTIQEKLVDFFLHIENKSSNGSSTGTMIRREIKDSVTEERLRSGKKINDTQIEIEW